MLWFFGRALASDVGHPGDTDFVLDAVHRPAVRLYREYGAERAAVRIQTDAQERWLHAQRMTVETVLSARSIRPEVGVVCFGSFPAGVQRCTAKRATDRGQDYASVPGGVHEIESVGKVCDRHASSRPHHAYPIAHLQALGIHPSGWLGAIGVEENWRCGLLGETTKIAAPCSARELAIEVALLVMQHTKLHDVFADVAQREHPIATLGECERIGRRGEPFAASVAELRPRVAGAPRSSPPAGLADLPAPDCASPH